MKKKILFILPGFNFGGTVFSTLNMISFLRKDYDISVLPMTYQGPIIAAYRDAKINLLPENIQLSAMAGRIDREPDILKKLIYVYYKSLRRACLYAGIDYEQFLYRRIARKIEKTYSFDYVASCQEGGSTYFASCFETSKRIAWFRSEYSVYMHQLKDWKIRKEQKLYQVFDKIVCVSQVTRDDFVNKYPSIDKKVYAIHNIQFVDSIVEKSTRAISDSFPNDKFNIVSVGRFAPQKRFSSIPQIVRNLMDRGLDFKWYIIGDGNMGGEWDKTQQAIEKYGVSDNLKCIGSRINPYPYMVSADLVVTPSYYEACPRVVIESKILHTPVVCADFSSAREFVKEGYDGYVCAINKIVEPIANMISNKELYKRIKSNCNQYVIDNDAIYKKLLTVFG